MSKANSLLEPFNIQIKFDIADPGQIQIGGASLSISFGFYPIIVGSYGFIAPGDYANSGRGAYFFLINDRG